jgi:hypothetical protein
MHRVVSATGILALFCGIVSTTAAEPAKEAPAAPGRLCVVWTSGDPEVATNVCFMYTGNAKKRGWFDEVRLVVWGPSARLLAGSKELQTELQAMQKAGVVTEACVACARNYGVVEALQNLKIDVKPMGAPLSERLKADWKVITF